MHYIIGSVEFHLGWMFRKYAEWSDILDFYVERSAINYDGGRCPGVHDVPLKFSDGYLDLLAGGEDMVCSDDENEPTLTDENEARFRRLLPSEYSKYSHIVQKIKAAELRRDGVFPCDICPFR